MTRIVGPRRPMSRAKTGADFSSVQPDLFKQLETPVLESVSAPELDIGPELMGAINSALRAARKCGYGRERVVERMNLALPDSERPITLRQLNAWTAASKEFHEFPLRYVAAFCWATGSDLPLRTLSNSMGYDLVDSREQAAKRLGETHLEVARLKREQKHLQGALS